MMAQPRTLIDDLLAEQRNLSAVERFSRAHARIGGEGPRYRELLPASRPASGQQYAFEVDLDQCSGCKACVTACHSLNGLEAGESWREVGQLISRDEAEPFQQTVTTACHHCIDPGCLNGCPVLAYEKEPSTGIVHHLDDQCIGCQYCILKCPYEVPKYSRQLGIVRKCDMCSQRLAAGEAPACVQACPNEAIAITLVDQDAARVKASRGVPGFLPASPDPRITLPTTRYLTARRPAGDVGSNNLREAKLQPPHWPLIAMLILTQLGVGAWCAGLVMAGPLQERLHLASLGATALGLLSSIPHLGQPLKAWKSFLGWRRSWMSREIIGFSVFFALASLSVGFFQLMGAGAGGGMALRLGAGIAGVVSVYCSGMIYHDTGRPTWRGWRSVGRFLLSSALLGCSCALVLAVVMGRPALGLGLVLIPLASLKLGLEVAWLFPRTSARVEQGEESPAAVSARLQRSYLGALTWARLSAAALGGLWLPGWAAFYPNLPATSICLILVVLAEGGERYSFFRTMVSRRMPGV